MATQFIDNNTNFESLDNWNGFDGIVTSDSFSCLHLSQTTANYTEYIELQENTTYTLWCEIKTTYTQYTYSNRGLLFDSYVVDSSGNEVDASGIDSWSIVSNSTLDAGEWRVIELRINTIEFEEDSDYSVIMLRPKFLFTDDETNGIDIYIKNVSLEDSDRRYFGENLLEDTVTLSNGMFDVGTLENTGYRYYGGYIYQTTTSLTDGIYCLLDDLLTKKILRYGDLLKFSIYVKSTLEETIETSFTLSPFNLYEETLLNDLWQRIEIEFTWSNEYESLVSNGIAIYLGSTTNLESTNVLYYALPMLEILGDNADKTDEQWIPNSNDEIYSEYIETLIKSYGRGTKGLSVYLYKDGETTYTDLTEKITSYKEDDSSSSTDSFTLGSIGSKNISMTVINYDDNGDELLPRDLTNYYIDVHKSFENIYDDSGNIYVDEEQFRIYENPETFSKSMSLEFQDRMAELSTIYDSKLYYPNITEDEETEDEETEKTDINNLFSQLNYLSKTQGGATIVNNSNGSFTISGSGTLTENYSNIYEYNGDTASEMIKEGTLILSVESVTTPYLKVSIYGVNTVYVDDEESEESTLLAEISTKELSEVQLAIDETITQNESFIIEVGFYGESGDTIVEGTIAPKLYYYVEETTDDDTENETQEIIETTLPTGEIGTWEVVLKYEDGTIISSTLMQSPTIKEQLEEIATSSDMEIDYSDIDESILNEYIAFYDSTYSKRQYLGWIAEKSSCNVFVRGNTIIFEKIDINDLKEQYIDYFSNELYVGDTFLIGRVCFDDGLEYYNKSVDLLDNDSGTYQLTASEDLNTLSLSLDTGHVVTLTSGNEYTFEFESNQNIGYTDGAVGAILYSSDDTQYNINIWASPTVFTCTHSGDYTLMFVFIASEVGSYATFSNFYLTEGEYSYTQLLGDTTYNTYYVDTTNMYITSQTDIDNIYDDLYKMEITGITGAKAIIGNANVRSTDLLKLRFIDELANKDEKKTPLITYIAKHTLTYNAEYSSSFECPVKSSNSENAESTTEESGTNTRIRKLSVSIDKTNLEMTVLAQQQTDLETKQSQFKLSLDQIALSVSSLSDYSQENYSSLSELASQVASAFDDIDLINKEISDFVTTSELESAIEVSESDIKLYVSSNYTSSVTLSETVTELQSEISQSASDVLSTVESTYVKTTTLSDYATSSYVTSQISIAEDSILQTVSGTYETIENVSVLQEQVDTVSGEVDTINSSLSTYATKSELSSSISQSETDILSTVSSTYYTSTKIDDLLTGYTTTDDVTKTIESYISISEGKIQLVVSENIYEVYTDESTDEILTNYVKEESVISSINQSAEEISISANKISLEGLVTANSYFIINEDGSMSTISGTIGGFIINENSIYSNGKDSIDNTIAGIYMDNSGQFVVGNSNGYIKFYQDSTSTWQFDILASSIKLTSGIDIEESLNQTIILEQRYFMNYESATDTPDEDDVSWVTSDNYTWVDGLYTWVKIVTLYANGETSTDIYCDSGNTGAQGEQGEKGDTGDSGVSISSITEFYALSTSSTTVTGTWTTTTQTMTSTNKYLWNYEVFTYSDTTTSKTSQRIIGVYGDNGETGENGVGIDDIVNYYLVSSSNSGITVSTSGWTTTVQTTTSTNKYLWNYEIVYYTDDTNYTSTPCIIGTYGDKGDDGEDAAISSDTEPEDTTKLWLDTSETPPILKQYVDYTTYDDDGETVTVQGWIAVNDQTEDVEELTNTVTQTFAELTETTDTISSRVDEYKVTVDEVSDDITSVSEQMQTLITQTAEDLEIKISSIDYGNTISDITSKLEKYFTFTESGLVIKDGTDTNATSLTLDNGIIYFNKNDNTTTYWDGNESNFFVGNIYVQTNQQARFGNFAWAPRDDGHLSLIEIGDDE